MPEAPEPSEPAPGGSGRRRIGRGAVVALVAVVVVGALLVAAALAATLAPHGAAPPPEASEPGSVPRPAPSGSGSQRFIQAVDESGRFFVDQTGQPILVKGDSPWSAFVDLSTDEWRAWCEDREARGFNAAIVSALGNSVNGGPSDSGATFDGLLPFSDRQFTPNEAYWERVDDFVGIAAQHGITVFLYPVDGWVVSESMHGVVARMSGDEAQRYGEWIARRYAAAPNVMWMGGGDFEPRVGTDGEVIHQGVFNGIRRFDSRPYSLQTIYQRSSSRMWPVWRDRVDWDFLYTRLPPYELVWESWELSPPRPALFGEGVYAGMYDNPPAATRMQLGWALTSGSPGDFYGTPDWSFEEGWQDRLGQETTQQVSAMRRAVEETAWFTLEPDKGFITSGAGTPYRFPFINDPASPSQFDDPDGPNASSSPPTLAEHDYATAAVAADGTLAIAYLPTAREITIDLAALGANPAGTWVDARSGASTPARLDALEPPSAGDWLLILHADAK